MPVSPATVVNNPDPATEAVVVTPSDSVNFTKPARGLYIGSAGNANLVMPNGDVVLFEGLLAGTILPVRCTRVNSTSTTGGIKIIALF